MLADDGIEREVGLFLHTKFKLPRGRFLGGFFLYFGDAKMLLCLTSPGPCQDRSLSMFCARCGTETLPEHKFCKTCGTAIGAAANAQGVAPAPPGMTAVMYQAYPGGPQPMCSVPTASMPPHAQSGFLERLRSQIRNLASTDRLEGFSLGEMFSEVFKRHTANEVEEYVMVGSERTTPPIDVVETGRPKPACWWARSAV